MKYALHMEYNAPFSQKGFLSNLFEMVSEQACHNISSTMTTVTTSADNSKPSNDTSNVNSSNPYFIHHFDYSNPTINAASSSGEEFSKQQLQQIVRALSLMNVNGNHDAYTNVASLCSPFNALANSVFTNSWILDSGATDHIISDSKHFTKVEPSSIPHINLPTGSSASVTSTGTVNFNQDITLNNVLCFPSFQLNLMSVSKVTDSLNCCAILFLKFCILQDLATGKMIGSGKQHGGLYYMSHLQQTPTCHQVSQSSDLWHM